MGQGRTSVDHNNINFEIFYHKTRLIVLIENRNLLQRLGLNETVYARRVDGESDLYQTFVHVN